MFEGTAQNVSSFHELIIAILDDPASYMNHS